MKKNFLLFLSAILLISCGSSSKDQTLVIADSLIKAKYSETEAKDVQYKNQELSEREAIEELLTKSQRDYQKYQEVSLLRQSGELLKRLEQAQQNRIYHRLEAIKAIPDTIVHALFYFDDKKQLVKAFYYH